MAKFSTEAHLKQCSTENLNQHGRQRGNWRTEQQGRNQHDNKWAELCIFRDSQTRSQWDRVSQSASVVSVTSQLVLGDWLSHLSLPGWNYSWPFMPTPHIHGFRGPSHLGVTWLTTKSLTKVSAHFIYTHTHIHVYTHIHAYIHTYTQKYKVLTCLPPKKNNAKNQTKIDFCTTLMSLSWNFHSLPFSPLPPFLLCQV